MARRSEPPGARGPGSLNRLNPRYLRHWFHRKYKTKHTRICQNAKARRSITVEFSILYCTYMWMSNWRFYNADRLDWRDIIPYLLAAAVKQLVSRCSVLQFSVSEYRWVIFYTVEHSTKIMPFITPREAQLVLGLGQCKISDNPVRRSEFWNLSRKRWTIQIAVKLCTIRPYNYSGHPSDCPGTREQSWFLRKCPSKNNWPPGTLKCPYFVVSPYFVSFESAVKSHK